MQKPSEALLSLYDIGVIGSIEIAYRKTPDEATYVKLHGNIGEIEGKWDDYKDLLKLEVGWNSVVSLLPEKSDEVTKWRTNKMLYEKELALYEKLKKKFGDS